MRHSVFLALGSPLLLLGLAIAALPGGPSWRKSVVSPGFLTEGLSVGDLDGDGVKDLVAGAFWFRGPDFAEPIAYRPGKPASIDGYMEDSFLSWVDDVDGDGRNDILMAAHPGRTITLYRNPGPDGEWTAHAVMNEAATESPAWTDLDRDGKNELICMQGGRFGYAEVDWEDVTRPWRFIAISDKRSDSPYVHGLGVGDLNGDGRPDVVEKSGWYEQPAAADGKWIRHDQPFASAGGAQMPVFDVDDDGDMDVVTSIDGHGYGLAWYENLGGGERFGRHEILPEDPSATGAGGLQFSQLHALAEGDFDGDGRIDFVTGKRFWAQNGRDPGARDPALLVIYYNRRGDDGVEWMPEVVDRDSGVGCQVQAVDLDGDGGLEVAAGSKKGVNVHARVK